MAIPIVKRYLITLGLYKWVGVATVALAIGVSGIVALQPVPEPKHTIIGTFRSIRPPVSNTGSTIQENAVAVTTDMLLNDEIRQAVAEQVLVNPKKLRRAKLSRTYAPSAISSRGVSCRPSETAVRPYRWCMT